MDPSTTLHPNAVIHFPTRSFNYHSPHTIFISLGTAPHDGGCMCMVRYATAITMKWSLGRMLDLYDWIMGTLARKQRETTLKYRARETGLVC